MTEQSRISWSRPILSNSEAERETIHSLMLRLNLNDLLSKFLLNRNDLILDYCVFKDGYYWSTFHKLQ